MVSMVKKLSEEEKIQLQCEARKLLTDPESE